MDTVNDKSFDFSIRIIELIKYLEEEKKPFPLCDRLLTCATGIGVFLRLVGAPGKSSVTNSKLALSWAVEMEYLLEIMVKTGYLTEIQSVPLLSDCRSLKTLLKEKSYKII